MPVGDITRAIVAEANAKANEPYSTVRKITSYLSNKAQGGFRSAVGGSTDAKSIAKVVGRNAVAASPQLAGQLAGKIPVAGEYVSTLTEKLSQVLVDKVVKKIDQARATELSAKGTAGTLTVREMTEMIQTQGVLKVTGDDIIGKMHDAVRKVETAYTAAKGAIVQAKDCDSMYKAAKNYVYLKYRVVRLQYYIEAIREHLDDVSAVNERYGAQVVGFEADLIDAMDNWFASVDSNYHKAHCKKDTCYYQQHGMTS